MKEQLFRRGLMDWDTASCSFCKAELETIGHLFFSCKSTWKVWMHCCSLWGVFGAIHLDLMISFTTWQHALPTNRCNKAWSMAYFAIV